MGKRRDARQLAVQFLYQHDLHPAEDRERALREFWELTERDEKIRAHTESLIQGVLEHRADIDEKIVSYAQNWDLQRMAIVDRNVLRLALFEMHYRDDIPPVASINEAIEIAKNLSTTDSGKFVNGILDRAKNDLKKSLR